jgi:hypothetical protein
MKLPPYAEEPRRGGVPAKLQFQLQLDTAACCGGKANYSRD